MKMILKYTKFFGMKWLLSLRIAFIDRLLENMQVNLHVPLESSNFLGSSANVSFSEELCCVHWSVVG
jgi:hypothetical protein